ncbi:MAG: BatA domain-containing protein [Planctomycetes bacterium]|nr:BatA domain-containing protein [Planctomycetota bacterium]
MTFASPALLWLGAMAAVPVILHLLNRRRYRRIDWAAMEFLLRAFQKTRRRVRLEELILLLLRITAMLLFAFALARPAVSQGLASALGADRLHRIVCIDASYSMAALEGARSRFDLAKEAASSLIEEIEGRGDVTLLKYADDVVPLASGAAGDISVREALDALRRPDCAVSDLPGVPVHLFRELARQYLGVSDLPRKEVILLTDLQRRGWDDEAVWRDASEVVQAVAQGASVTLVDVTRDPVSNLAITDFSATSRFVSPGRPARFSVTVRNFGEAHPGEIQVDLYEGTGPGRIRRWEGQIDDGLDAGQEKTLTLFYTFRDSGAHALTVEIGADRLRSDDERHLSVSVRNRVRVMVVDGTPSGEDPLRGTSLLEWALTLGGASPIDVERVPLWRFRNEDAHDFASCGAVFLCNVRSIPRGSPDRPGQLERLASYARNGGGLVFFLGEEIDVPFYNDVLFAGGEGILPCRIGEAREASEDRFYNMAVDTTHPMAPWFQDYAFHLGYAFVRKHRALEIPEGGAARSVLTWSEGGGSALVERPVGLGASYCFGVPCDRSWGDFPACYAYLAIVHDLAYVLSESGARRNALAGEPLQELLPARFLAEPMTVTGPGPEFAVQEVHPEEAQEDRATVRFGHGSAEARRSVSSAGVYALEIGRPVRERFFHARNVDPAEGDLARADASEISRRLEPARVTVIDTLDSLREKIADTADTREWWTLALTCLLGIFALESLLARWFSSRQ